MKKLLVLMMALVMTLSLAACGGPDVSSLVKTQSEVAREFNELATLINDNGVADEATAAMLNDYSDTLAEVAEACKAPSGYEQAAIDEMENGLREMQSAIAVMAQEIKAQIDVSAPDASDVTLVSREANFTTLLVPRDFGEFYDKDGYAVVEGTNANIIVTPTIEPDIRIEDITEGYMVDLMGDTYSNIKVLAFDNPVTIAGVDAVSFMFTGDGATSGKNKTVCHLTLFLPIEGQACEQQLIFTYDTGANTSLEANLDDMIEGISLE